MAESTAELEELRIRRKESQALDERITGLANDLDKSLKMKGWSEISQIHFEKAFRKAKELWVVRTVSDTVEEMIYAILKTRADMGNLGVPYTKNPRDPAKLDALMDLALEEVMDKLHRRWMNRPRPPANNVRERQGP